MKFHNLHEIDAANVYILFSQCKIIFLADKVQQVEILTTSFDYKNFLEPVSTFSGSEVIHGLHVRG